MKLINITNSITNRNDFSIKQFLKEISEIETFTPESEMECAIKAASGDEEAKQELVTRNLRFVVSVAKKYVTKDIPLSDLINEGAIGMTMAVERFKPETGNKFISYGVYWVRKVILEHITKYGKAVRLPSNKVSDLSKLGKRLSEMEQAKGHEVKASDAAIELDDEDFRFLDILSNYKMDSLDKQVGHDNDGSSLYELISDVNVNEPDFLVNDLDIKDEIESILSSLKPRDKRIMIAYFGLDGNYPMNLKDIGDEVGLTREMVRQVKEKSLLKLKNSRLSELYY